MGAAAEQGESIDQFDRSERPVGRRRGANSEVIQQEGPRRCEALLMVVGWIFVLGVEL